MARPVERVLMEDVASGLHVRDKPVQHMVAAPPRKKDLGPF